MLELQALAPWVSVAVAIAALWYTAVSNRSKATNERLNSLAGEVAAKADVATVQIVLGKVDLLEDRVTRLETHVEHLPDKDAAHRMEMSIAALSGEVRALSERIKPVAAISERLQEFLIEEARARKGS